MATKIVRRSAVAAGALPGVHPVLARVYAARGVDCVEDVTHRLEGLLPPAALGGLEPACDLLEQAIRNDARIVVVGDFDADGATATAVALRGLRLLGARNVGYLIPNRARHGYGLSPAIVEELRDAPPALLVTVDNGIAAHAGVDAARALGIRVIVTDHHLPGDTLPHADAIVNPVLSRACAEPAKSGDIPPQSTTATSAAAALRHLAGVGVMFYLLLALRARLFPRIDGEGPTSDGRPDLAALLDLVALGTVADMVPLDRNNRILVQAGLRRIQSGRACAGVAALLAAASRHPARLSANDLGFAVAPRINAAGRLEDMRLGVECLLTDNHSRAQEMAARLSAINAQRRELQADMVAAAHSEVERWIGARGEHRLPHGVVLYDEQWHHGVVGLVASRLKDALHRPVIAFAPAAGDAGSIELKGSGRSVAGFHLRDALAEIDARHPGLIRRFGGHAMAAGLNLQPDQLQAFMQAFDDVVRRGIAPEMLEAAVLTDGELHGDDFGLELARLLRAGGPWGQAFPEPLFDGVFAVQAWKVVGETHLRLDLRHDDAAGTLQGIMFNGYEGAAPPQRLRAAFHLDINEWQAVERLQLMIRHIEPV